MNSLWTLRHRLSTRLALFVAILLFSATAVEVAPQAIDALRDLGWLPPDVADAAKPEAAARARVDESRNSGSASGTVDVVDSAALGRLVEFTESQPDALDSPVASSASINNADQPTATALLEGVVSLDSATDAATAPSRAHRSNGAGWSSSSAFGSSAAEAVLDAGTMPNELPVTTTAEEVTEERPAAAGHELTSSQSERMSTTEAGLTTTAPPAGGGNSANDFGPAPVGTGSDGSASSSLVPADANLGSGTEASLDVSPVAVPEPTTLLMFGAGLLGLASFRKRKIAR